MQPIVSVLVLNYRNANATVRCVQELKQQTLADEIEILVIDNHSEDDSIGILRNRLSGYANVRIIETPHNNGFGYGYNTGASYAKGTYLLINNPDKILESNGIEKLVAKLKNQESIGIIGPKLVHEDGTRRLSIRTFPRIIDILSRRSMLGALFPKALDRYLMADANPDSEMQVDWLVGGCFMMPMALFMSIGGFDERFFLFFEDTDLCRRVRQTGAVVVYAPSIVARDKSNRLSGESLFDLFFKKTGRIHMVSALKYFWKWRKTA